MSAGFYRNLKNPGKLRNSIIVYKHIFSVQFQRIVLKGTEQKFCYVSSYLEAADLDGLGVLIINKPSV